jgi:hypothetical protein
LGQWSFTDVQYDKEQSTLTGTNLGNVSNFDEINVHGKLSASSLAIPYDQSNAFSSDVIVEKDNVLYKSNAAIPAGTEFVEGQTGQTWSALSSTTGLSAYNWSLDTEYKTTNLVIKDNAWFQANDNIPENTPFTLGVTGATWKPISSGPGSLWTPNNW